MPDALELIQTDHRNVEALFQRYEASNDPGEQTDIVREVIHELAVHGEIEELLFYPKVADRAPQGGRLSEEAVHEHVEMKEILNDLDSMTASDDGFDEKMRELIADTREHIQEEENEIFPAIRQVMNEEELAELGSQLEDAKSVVPTRPHPKAPTSPAGKAVAAPGAALVDRIRDAIRNRSS